MRDGVDVHLLHMDDEGDTAPLRALLSDDELGQAARFRGPLGARRYVVRHAWLRRQLALYLGEPPRKLRLRLNAFGKPSLADGGVHFSLSRSRGFALLAVADRPVGCDLEWRDNGFPYEDVSAQFFTSREARALADLPAESRAEAFFTRWTCKEAYVKACGLGMALPLDSFDVEVAGGRGRLGAGCAGWSVACFEPIAGYQAAVVAAGEGWRLRRCWASEAAPAS
jgi:4'-phosphopantetheinyl transferase